MTARDERVVWTVPGTAADPPGSAAGQERISPCVFVIRSDSGDVV